MIDYWTKSDGSLIVLCDMDNKHLTNTIHMLKRQIDGSSHDDFCWDNIDAMEKELERRNNMEKIKNVTLKVVGVTFKNDDGSSRSDTITNISESRKKEEISIEIIREPNNKYDVNAIKVFADNKQIGYIGKDYSELLAPMLDAGRTFSCSVNNIGVYKSRPYCEILVDEN